MFFDPETRILLRTRPNRLTVDDLVRVQGLRKAGPPHGPRPNLSASSGASPPPK
jgi:hypothetical protein